MTYIENNIYTVNK